MILSINLVLSRPIFIVDYYSDPLGMPKAPHTYETVFSKTVYIDVEKEEIESFFISDKRVEIILKHPEKKFEHTLNLTSSYIDKEYRSRLEIHTFLDEKDTEFLQNFNKLFSLDDEFIESRLVKENVE